MEIALPFLKALLLVPLTLLPIINPLSGAPVFSLQAGDEPLLIRRMARQVAINCWIIIVVSMLVGSHVLDLFGISLPIVRLGGGLLVATTGWRMLHSAGDDDMHRAIARQSNAMPDDAEIMRRSFFPVTFPLTTGPGTIAAAIALGANRPGSPLHFLLDVLVTLLGSALTVAVVYLVYRNAAHLLNRLGEVGRMVMMRLLAFILLCIGIEIMWAGWSALHPGAG